MIKQTLIDDILKINDVLDDMYYYKELYSNIPYNIGKISSMYQIIDEKLNKYNIVFFETNGKLYLSFINNIIDYISLDDIKRIKTIRDILK